MRIAYVALGIEPHNLAGGVGRKIHTQLQLWTESGHVTRLFALVPQCADPEVYTYSAYSNLPGIKQASRAISRSRALGKLIAEVQGLRPDIIYLRFGSYLYPLHRLFRIAPVVAELNSNDIAQRSLQGAYAYWLNFVTRALVLRNVVGLIAVTGEIMRLPANRRYGKPSCVIGNGIDLGRYDPLPAPRHARPTLTLVGSPGMRWHGVDKLAYLARACPDLTVNIVGYGAKDLAYPLPANVKASGLLNEAGVRAVLMETDVACSSLALHRNRMEEGSTLKVPEAMAYGIPILLAYRDTELSDLQSDCILQLPNTEDNVASHVDEIRSFAYRMLGRRLSREDVAPCIDQRLKEKRRLAFFAQMMEQGQHATG